MERGLTIKEAAALLPCNRSTIRCMMHDGRLPKSTYYHIGTRMYFLPDKLDEWKHNGGTRAVNR